MPTLYTLADMQTFPSMTDEEAKSIAMQWAINFDDFFGWFAKHGTIDDEHYVKLSIRELHNEYAQTRVDQMNLHRLWFYVNEHKTRGPVADWDCLPLVQPWDGKPLAE